MQFNLPPPHPFVNKKLKTHYARIMFFFSTFGGLGVLCYRRSTSCVAIARRGRWGLGDPPETISTLESVAPCGHCPFGMSPIAPRGTPKRWVGAMPRTSLCSCIYGGASIPVDLVWFSLYTHCARKVAWGILLCVAAAFSSGMGYSKLPGAGLAIAA